MDVEEPLSSTAQRRWRYRRRRLVTGANVATAMALAAVLATMINMIGARRFLRWDVSQERYYTMSTNTVRFLDQIQGEVAIDVVYSPNHSSFKDLRYLLDEYAYAARHAASTVDLRIRYIDPDRDLGRMKELKERFGIEERNLLVLSVEQRRKVVQDSELYTVWPLTRERIMFHGESVISSALLNLTREKTPVVYVLKGHGERDPWSFHERYGYSKIARLLQRDNIELKPLVLAAMKGVPADADALLIAGPTRRYSDEETELISEYIEKSGRVLFLLDPYVKTGFEPLIETWGVHLEDDLVVDTTSLSGGREFYVGTFGEHPVSDQLQNTLLMFSGPRSVEPAASAGTNGVQRSDRPKITGLAMTSKQSWAKLDPSDRGLGFDAAVDRRGPITVAAAMERGAASGEAMEIETAKIVVIGDSDIIGNAVLNSGAGGNVGFVMSAMNWLLERESIMGIQPRPVQMHALTMDRDLYKRVGLALVVGIPAAVAFLGVLIWMNRRR